MATYTNKLNLIKPEINDLVSPTVFADNFDKIDAAYGGLSSDLATTDSNLEKLNSNLNTKQNASTAITTSNIGNQTVANAVKWNGLTNDVGTNNTTDTWVAVVGSNNKLQHREIPLNLMKSGQARSNFAQVDNLNCGFDVNINAFVIDLVFADNTAARLLFNDTEIYYQYYDGSSWYNKWRK